MPNLISQMRNGTPQVPPQLSNSIQQVRGMMEAMRQSPNPQDYIMRYLGQNPALLKAVQQGNLQQIAEQMARERGIDLNDLIHQLGG